VGSRYFVERLKHILTGKARAGVRGGLLYDPLGSHVHLTRAYIRDMVTQTSRAVPTVRV